MPFALTRPRDKAASQGQEMVITEDFQRAFELLETTPDNVLITGKAGTGKSTFLDWLRRTSEKNIAVVAPTGVAALNVRGQTIHSLFQLKPCFQHPDSTFKLYGENAAVLKHLDILVVDEVSMVRADVFDAMAQLMKRYGRRRGQPFGGIQMCLIGDLMQLPPVVSGQEAEMFSRFYAGAGVMHARAWGQTAWRAVEFGGIFRQTDPEFVAALNAIRCGQAGAEVMEYLNRRCLPAAEIPQDVVTLTARTTTADAINTRMLQALPGRLATYTATRKGTFTRDKADKLPSPEQLLLKPGAQVMFTKNDGGGRRWVNGTLGKVISLSEDVITVRTESDVVEVARESWQSVRFGVGADGAVTEDETGRYTQFPLMPAWAITIHKSQGKTLERVVIDLEGGAFAPGQLYVALSRARRYDGLWLRRRLSQRDVMAVRMEPLPNCPPPAPRLI